MQHTPVTFDLQPFSVAGRRGWWAQFRRRGRYRLIVAETDGRVVGYAGSTRFRTKAAYDTTVETTIYVDPLWRGRGIGGRLYEALFRALRSEDIRRIIAAYTLPNRATARLHRRFGFRPVGVFREAGRKFGRFWDVAWVERPLRVSRRGRGSPTRRHRARAPSVGPRERLTLK